jgi:hypothetical protein
LRLRWVICSMKKDDPMFKRSQLTNWMDSLCCNAA